MRPLYWLWCACAYRAYVALPTGALPFWLELKLLPAVGDFAYWDGRRRDFWRPWRPEPPPSQAAIDAMFDQLESAPASFMGAV